MYNFFAAENSRQGDNYSITGQDHNHIKNVLRMRTGDTILVSENKMSSLCKIVNIEEDFTLAQVMEENFRNTELPLQIYLFQGLPKADKMELIIQKCVELGVYEIIPTEMQRCVVKLDGKKKSSKRERWQAISESAAKQSKRNIIPAVSPVLSFKEALEKAKDLDLLIVPYENEKGMKETKNTLAKIRKGSRVGIFIGSEGGFEESEIEKAKEIGAVAVSLGERILRTETAAITSVGMCMLYAEMFLTGDTQ